jgi:hypothetical protein
VSKWKVRQVFNNNPQGSRLRGRPKANSVTVYEQILLNAKLQIEREVKYRAVWEKSVKEGKVPIGVY